jgi:hypothetical protein
MGKPTRVCGYPLSNVFGGSPREVKHLSTERKRKQERAVFRSRVCSCEWNTSLAIPLVAASETGEAQTSFFGKGGCKAEAPYLYGKSYKHYI